MSTQLRLIRYDSAGTFALADGLQAVYFASHRDQQDNPWYSPEQFWQRFEKLYAPIPDFELVAGWIDDRMAGYAFGTPCGHPHAVWDKAQQIFPQLTAVQTPSVYLFREFAVHPEHQGKGYGRAIHDALLSGRREALASLLVRVGNPVKDVYQSWGWRVIGREQPFIDAPMMDEMALPLNPE